MNWACHCLTYVICTTQVLNREFLSRFSMRQVETMRMNACLREIGDTMRHHVPIFLNLRRLMYLRSSVLLTFRILNSCRDFSLSHCSSVPRVQSHSSFSKIRVIRESVSYVSSSCPGVLFLVPWCFMVIPLLFGCGYAALRSSAFICGSVFSSFLGCGFTGLSAR